MTGKISRTRGFNQRLSDHGGCSVWSWSVLTGLAAVLCLPSVGVCVQEERESRSTESQVDFRREILPIFQDRCFECHSGEASEGDLRLHTERNARRGGHTGRRLLVAPATESELYQRLISTDLGYRMPKSGDPLSEAEIDLIKTWLDQGASWNDPATSESNERESGSPDDNRARQSSLLDRLGQGVYELLETLNQPRFRHAGIAGWLFGACLLYLVLLIATKLKQFRRRRGRAVSISNSVAAPASQDLRDRLFKWRYLLLGLSIVSVISGLLYQQGLIEELSESVVKANNSGRRQPALKITENRQALVLPVYPDHPPRLGGLYYRGNDERDPALFNGGVYRTATIEVWLVNDRDEKIEWNDDLTRQPLFISLVIRRAPRTTSALFNQSIFRETYLRRFRETELESGNAADESQEIRFTELEPEQAWAARIPLEPPFDWKDGKNAGVVYLFYGSQVEDGFKGRVHYGIRYELSLTNGKLSPASVLWMGAIYDLGGRVLIPQDKEVPLSQWFDYRPLPEIENDNPDNPKLLGLPEHLNSGSRQ